MFKIKRASDNQYYYTFVADNGQILVTSETYTTEHDARRGVDDFIDEFKSLIRLEIDRSNVISYG